jgi:hypothetical protein
MIAAMRSSTAPPPVRSLAAAASSAFGAASPTAGSRRFAGSPREERFRTVTLRTARDHMAVMTR